MQKMLQSQDAQHNKSSNRQRDYYHVKRKAFKRVMRLMQKMLQNQDGQHNKSSNRQQDYYHLLCSDKGKKEKKA